MIRILAIAVPQPALPGRRDAPPPRWDAIREDTGELLAEATDYPLIDGAYALTKRGVPKGTLISLRLEGAELDTVKPTPIDVPAKLGRLRAAKRAKLRPPTRTERTAPCGC